MIELDFQSEPDCVVETQRRALLMGDVEFVCAKGQASPARAFVMVNGQMGERNTSASNGIGKPSGGSQHHRGDPWAVGIAGDPSQCL